MTTLGHVACRAFTRAKIWLDKHDLTAVILLNLHYSETL